MQLGHQASQLSLALAANSRLSGIVRFTLSITPFSKYGHFCFQKTTWQRPKSKLEDSKRQSTNQWVASQPLSPLCIQSMVQTHKLSIFIFIWQNILRFKRLVSQTPGCLLCVASQLPRLPQSSKTWQLTMTTMWFGRWLMAQQRLQGALSHGRLNAFQCRNL